MTWSGAHGLEGRGVVVTGAAGGIGGAVARALASAEPAMAGCNAVAGGRGLIAASAAGPLAQPNLVDPTTGMVPCAVAAMLGVAESWRMRAGPRGGRPRPVPA